MQQKLINISVFLFGILIALLLGEGLIQTFLPQKLMRPHLIADPDIAFRGAKHCAYLDDWTPEFYEYYVKLNNHGLRMNQDILPKDTNAVLCLGDSFTYGMGVNFDDSFYAHLSRWPEKFGIRTNFINGGFQAYSTGHVTKQLKKLDKVLDIDKVIYFMYFNDLFDNVNQDINYRTHEFDLNESGVVTLKEVQVYSPFKRFWHQLGITDWLYKNSHFIIFLKNSLSSKRTSFVNNDPRKDSILTKEELHLMQKVTLQHIENLAQICAERNLALSIIWIPCWLELDLVNDFDWNNNFPFADFKRALDESVRGLGTVSFFDATAGMNTLLEGKKAAVSDYYYGEGHYNKNGNLLFFNAVKEEILRCVTEN